MLYDFWPVGMDWTKARIPAPYREGEPLRRTAERVMKYALIFLLIAPFEAIFKNGTVFLINFGITILNTCSELMNPSHYYRRQK